MGVVYMATNKTNGHSYVGMTIGSFRRRMMRHYTEAERGIGFKFANAIRAYGRSVWEWKILFESEDRNLLCKKEIEFVAKYGYYNITGGGDGARGTVTSDETKKKISQSLTGIIFTQQRRENISRAQRGKPKKPLTQETKAKISAAHKGKKRGPFSEERAEKQKGCQKGKYVSPETCAKISASKTGKKKPPTRQEVREKLSIAAKAYWSKKKQEVSNAAV